MPHPQRCSFQQLRKFDLKGCYSALNVVAFVTSCAVLFALSYERAFSLPSRVRAHCFRLASTTS